MTAIEENELKTELQELYLKNKQWITDLAFLETELVFLKSFLQKVENNQQENIADRLSGSETVITKLKTDLLAYLHKIETLIKYPGQFFDLSIIETYALLESRSIEALKLFKELKALYLTKQQVKTVC